MRRKQTFLITLILLSAVAMAQKVRPVANAGKVENGTYTNSYLGVEFTPPAGLSFGNPEMRGTPGSLPLLITVTAAEAPQPTRATNVIAFYSDEQAYYPAAKRTAEAYRDRVVRSQINDGFRQVQGLSEASVSGNKFLRVDFQKERVYEAVLVGNHLGQALVFIFAADSQQTVDNLIAGTKLKLSQ